MYLWFVYVGTIRRIILQIGTVKHITAKNVPVKYFRTIRRNET